MLELGLDPNRIPKRKRTEYYLSVVLVKKIAVLRNFLRLPTTIVLEMALDALVSFINQRHLANGGSESELLSWNPEMVDNPAFYDTTRKYWGGRPSNAMANKVSNDRSEDDQQVK